MWAQQEIVKILTECNQLHGWQIPYRLVEYQSEILAARIDEPLWRPEPSYAERYMQLRSSAEALALANVCWFTRAVFPELGERRGIDSSYYVQIGQSCYEIARRSAPDARLDLMTRHFEFLAECAYTAIRHYGKFRSMWD